MMKLRLATPDHLVDLAGVAELKACDADGADVVIGRHDHPVRGRRL